MKEIIKLDFSVANDKEIHITGSSTSFCSHIFKEEIDIPLLLEKRKALIKKAKKNGLKISYKNKTKTKLQNLSEEYQSDYIDYLFLYNSLSKKWNEKLKKGIFVGYSNDIEIDYLFSLSRKIDYIFLKKQAFKIVNDISYKINYYEKYLDEYNIIYL